MRYSQLPSLTIQLGSTTTAPRNASACAAFCDSLGSTCIGFAFGSQVPFYNGPACQPKQNAASSAAALKTSTVWSVWLRGSCGEYSSASECYRPEVWGSLFLSLTCQLLLHAVTPEPTPLVLEPLVFRLDTRDMSASKSIATYSITLIE